MCSWNDIDTRETAEQAIKANELAERSVVGVSMIRALSAKS